MARKHSFFGTILTVGGIAAVGTLLYRKHKDLIQTFVQELTEAPADDAAVWEEAETVEAPEEPEIEVDIVIDQTEEKEAD